MKFISFKKYLTNAAKKKDTKGGLKKIAHFIYHAEYHFYN